MIERSPEYWRKKLAAILHDPITKAFEIIRHEEFSRSLKSKLGLEIERGVEDRIASAMDRIPLPFENDHGKKITVRTEELEILHPFSGEPLHFSAEFLHLKEKLKSVLEAKLVALRDKYPDSEKLYHAVWWCLPYLIPYAQFLPADTRVPNHSIIDHLDTTAALVPCVNGKNVKASLIAMQIGPVQETIAQARKVRDLWAGSYLISYLMYGALEELGLGLGFDSIIYPYLRNVSFLRETMKMIGIEPPDELLKLPKMSDRVACLPNVFVAIVPSDEAQEWIQKCEKAIVDRWKNLVEKTQELVVEKGFNLDPSSFQKQVEIFPSIMKAHVDLISPSKAKDEVKKFFKNSDIEIYSEVLQEIARREGYNPNEGSYYNYSYRILTSKLSAIKSQRFFPPYEEDRIGQIVEADDFGAGVKACAEIVETFENEEKRDLLGAVNTVKRMFSEILRKNIPYESTHDIALKNEANGKDPNKMENQYFAVLVMDGDQMGKWVSGEKAPTIEEILHTKAKDILAKDLPELWRKFKDKKLVQPSYHRQLSRTLGVFSSLVEYVVEENEGMLVYCGGDDVLALLPADKVLKCANQLRKFFRGEPVSLKVNGHQYDSNHGVLYVDNEPFAPLMGSRATISAGICVVHQKFPLQVAIKLAREAEERAKEDYGRDSFSIFFVRRSGQITEVGSKWMIDDLDVVDELEKILNQMSELEISNRSLFKLLSKDIVLLAANEDDLQRFVHYTIRRSTRAKEIEKVESLADEIYSFIKNYRAHFSASSVEELRGEACTPLDPQIHSGVLGTKKAIELILTYRTMKRGDER